MLPNGVFEFDTQKKTFESGDNYFNVMKIPKGCAIGKHQHDYTHTSVLLSGSVVLRIGGIKDKPLSGLSFVDIEANTSHVIHALEDSVWMCIHPKSNMNDFDQVQLVVGG